MSFVYAKVRQNPNITRQIQEKYRDLADYIIFLQENTYTNINLSFYLCNFKSPSFTHPNRFMIAWKNKLRTAGAMK